MIHMEQPTKRELQLATAVGQAIASAGHQVADVAVRAGVSAENALLAIAGVRSFAFSDVCAIADTLGVAPSALFREAEQIGT